MLYCAFLLSCCVLNWASFLLRSFLTAASSASATAASSASSVCLNLCAAVASSVLNLDAAAASSVRRLVPLCTGFDQRNCVSCRAPTMVSPFFYPILALTVTLLLWWLAPPSLPVSSGYPSGVPTPCLTFILSSSLNCLFWDHPLFSYYFGFFIWLSYLRFELLMLSLNANYWVSSLLVSDLPLVCLERRFLLLFLPREIQQS